MAYLLRIYQENRLSDFEITSSTPVFVGAGKDRVMSFVLPDLQKQRLRIKITSEGWQYQATRPIAYDNTKPKSSILPFGQLLLLHPQCAVTVYEADHNNTQIVNLVGQEKVLIGRSSSCDIVVSDRMVSSKHLELRPTANGWVMQDLDSSNGTYLNGQRVKNTNLASGDVLDIGLCRLILVENALSISYRGDIAVHITPSSPIKSADHIEDVYPYAFRLSPRLMKELPEEEITLQQAPHTASQPSINWVNILLPPIASIGVMIGASYALGGAMTMLYFSVPTTVVGLLMSIYGYKSQRRSYKKAVELRRLKYQEYLQHQETKVKDLIDTHRMILLETHPPVGECLNIVQKLNRRLWERRPIDADFMELRIGEGAVPSRISFRIPSQQLSLEEDELASLPQELSQRYQMVEGCPIVYKAGLSPTCGIIGERAACIGLAKNMVLQAVTHHSYEDLRIVLVCSQDEFTEWEFIKWLPHNFDNSRSMRYIADNLSAAQRVFSTLGEILGDRLQNKEISGQSRRSVAPYYLFICANKELLAQQTIMKYITANDTQLGVSALFLYDRLDALPQECSVIIELKGKKSVIYSSDNTANRQTFIADRLLPQQYEQFARALAPIRVEATSTKAELPTIISFLQGYKAKTPGEIDISLRWKQSRPEVSMAIPIGLRGNGEPFFFDIHEKQHGPHGIVAGMTGSGKSEMVQSWILSMALTFPPEAVSFVLIDFKGTGLILPFRNLPHLAGTISDLDVNITRNLIALENELTRRKALLDEAGVSNISGYLKLYRQGKVQQPLSYLMIVIDEFAEFKVQFPEFMQVINRVFAIGRTLGVHIILLTQKPAGVIDDKMSANTRFRWCLKVASSADSKEMLRHPDAVRITNPGRAFVQVGEDEIFEEIQSYYSGAAYNPMFSSGMQLGSSVAVVDIHGLRRYYEPEKTTGFRSDKNEIDAIVEYLDNYVRKSNIARAQNIWTNKLKAQIYLSEILQIAFDGHNWNQTVSGLCPAVGMIDDPRSQSQYPLTLNFADEGHIVIYGAPGTGKTTFLHTLVLSLALSYAPDTLSLYLLDFGGGSLNLFRKLPHVGTVATDAETEKVEKLCQMLTNEIQQRKQAFAESGVLNIDAYRELTQKQLPYILLIMDNIAPAIQLYPELDSFLQMLTREGGNYGVYLAVTAHSQNAVPFRVAQNIKFRVALNLADSSEYSAIVGRTNGLEPENLPGRGLVKNQPPLEFQTALPASGQTESERVGEIRRLVELMNQKWNGPRPASVPVLPEVVYVRDYPTDGLLLGLSVSSIQPEQIDFSERPFLLLSGLDQTIYEPLNVLAAQLRDKMPSAQVIVCDIDGVRPQLRNAADRYITTGQELDDTIAGLMPILQQRKDRLQENDLAFLDEQQPIVLVLPDLCQCFEAASDDTMRRFSNIVRLGQGLKVYLIVAGQHSDIARLYHSGDPFTYNLVNSAAAFIFGGRLQDHILFQSDLSYTETGKELAANQAYLLIDSKATKIQYVQG